MPHPSHSLCVGSKGGRRGLLQTEATQTAQTISTAAHRSKKHAEDQFVKAFNPLNTKLNPICHLAALLEDHHILHVGRIKP